jgi:hypothetical protein
MHEIWEVQVEILLRRFSRDWRLLGNFVKENSKLNFVKISQNIYSFYVIDETTWSLHKKFSPFFFYFLKTPKIYETDDVWKKEKKKKIQAIQMLVPNPLHSFLKKNQVIWCVVDRAS